MATNPQDELQTRLSNIRRDAEERDAERRAERTGYGYVDVRKEPVSVEALRLIPEVEAKEAKMAAIELKVRKVAIAVFDPHAPVVEAIVQRLEAQKYEVKMFVASLSGLTEAWRFYKFVAAEGVDITGKVEIGKTRFEDLVARLTTFGAVHEEMTGIAWEKATTTAVFEVILAGALGLHASDIHFEAEEKHARIRYRLDGVLHDVYGELPPKNYETLVSRVKLLSNLKINIHGEPQDGRFTITLPGKEVEIRVSIIPSEFGETIVMRILDPDTIKVDLMALGLRKDALDLVHRELAKPNGLILNTGPTGSGKTTTLYAFLKELTNPEMKVITIEDPIEYRISGIEQTQVKEDTGYTFAGGLRAILRQDPDVILVGEIRDHETADIALQAALTGHLVLSTLHTNDALGAVPRLTDLGIMTQTIGPALSLIIAQRLVRILCPHCKKERPIDADLRAKIDGFLARLPAAVDREPYRDIHVFEPASCDKCGGFGYRGRTGVFEFFEGGPEFEELILKETSEVALRKLAVKQGMVTMQEDGILRVIQGQTSFDEVTKVTGPIAW